MVLNELTVENKKAILRESSLFKNVSEQLIDKVVLNSIIENWKKHTLVVDSEKTLKRFYIILKGRLKIFRINPNNGREQTIFLLGPGDGFDVICLLDGVEHPVLSESLDELITMSVSNDIVRNWIHEYPEFNKNLLPYLCYQFREIEDLATNLSFYDTWTRLVKLLLRYSLPNKEGMRFNLINKLSHEELASIIGSVRVVVNRHLQILKRDGVIVIKRGEIEIHNISLLLDKVQKSLKIK